MGDNDFDYDEIQNKLNPPSDVADAEGNEPEAEGPYDGDDWTIVDPVDEAEESVDDEDEETPESTPKTPEAKKPEPPVDDSALKETLIRQLGEDFTLKVKGIERKLKDIPSTELKNGLQKAFRSDQIFNELSAERKQVEDEKRRYEEQRMRQEMEFERLRSEMDMLKRGAPRPVDPYTGQPIDQYDTSFSPTDSPEARQYKSQLAETQKRLAEIENGMKQTSQQQFVSGIENEIRTLSKEYPMAPLDEVIAVKLARPEVKTEDLMKAAHDYYRGDQHIELALANNPEYRQKLAESIVKSYLAKRQSARKITGVPKGSSGSERVTESRKAVIRDFKGADAAAAAYLKEMGRRSD